MGYLHSVIVKEDCKVTTCTGGYLRREVNIDGVYLTGFILIRAGGTHSHCERAWGSALN